MKLYTEEQLKKAIAIGFDWCHQKHIPSDDMIDTFIKQLTPIELPSDEDIEEKFSIGTEEQKNNYLVNAFIQAQIFSAKWMRDKINNL